MVWICAVSLSVFAAEPLRVAMSGSYPPLHDRQGQTFVGFEPDLAALLAEKLGRDLVLVDAKALGTSTLEAVVSGKADIAMNAITDTPERRKTVDFTRSYLDLQYRIAGVHDLSDLSAMTGRAVALSPLAAEALQAIAPGVALVPADKRGLDAIWSGEADWVVGEDVALMQAIASNRLLPSGPPFGRSPIAIATRKGRASEIDTALAALRPEIARLKERWRPGELASLLQTGLSGVSVGTGPICALRADQTPICWGEETFNGTPYPPSGRYTALFAGAFCGLREDSEIDCWGPYANTAPAGPFSRVRGWGPHLCGQRADGRLGCWSVYGDRAVLSRLPEEPVGEFCVGGQYACAIGPDGRARCWGSHPADIHVTPDVPLRSLSCGDTHVCGLTGEGRALCWGNRGFIDHSPVRDGIYEAIFAGYGQTCGISVGGIAACFDRQGQKMDWPGPSPLSALTSGSGGRGCATDAYGRISCQYSIDDSPTTASRAVAGDAVRAIPSAWKFVSSRGGEVFFGCGDKHRGIFLGDEWVSSFYGDSEVSELISVHRLDGSDRYLIRTRTGTAMLQWPISLGGVRVGRWTGFERDEHFVPKATRLPEEACPEDEDDSAP